jgi:hypothetical protein
MTEGTFDAPGADLPSRIELGASAEVRLPLPSAAGGGYVWSAAPTGGDAGAARMRIEVGPMPPRGGEPTSALAPVTLVVAGDRPGVASWRLRLARPWEPDRPLVDRLVEVTVSGGPA